MKEKKRKVKRNRRRKRKSVRNIPNKGRNIYG